MHAADQAAMLCQISLLRLSVPMHVCPTCDDKEVVIYTLSAMHDTSKDLQMHLLLGEA